MVIRVSALAVTVLLLGCSTTSVGFRPAEMATITVTYSAGGPAPSAGIIQVFQDGIVVARNQEGRLRRHSFAKHPIFQELVDQLARKEFQEALLVLEARRYDELFFDYEEITVEALGHSASIPTERLEELPPAIKPILDLLDTLAESLLQGALDFHLGSKESSSATIPTEG